MERKYSHLNLNNRIEIYRLRSEGKSYREIGAYLGRSASTICREFGRNCGDRRGRKGPYDPVKADHRHWIRRRMRRRFKLARQPILRSFVRNRLVMGWSPEQISGWLARLQHPMQISHESIYRYIYHRSHHRDYWHKLLPLQRYRRGHKRRRQGPMDVIKGRQSVDLRCLQANQRQVPGHWESDLMCFSIPGPVLLVLQERQSRYIHIQYRAHKSSGPSMEYLDSYFSHLPKGLRSSVTFDNGTEFALHYKLIETLNMQTFFCDPYSPWQKGGVENAIGRLRRSLPRKSDLAKITQRELDILTNRYNNTPRKCLNYKTPSEVFMEKLNSVALQV